MSPLVSLIKSQVAHLKNLGMSAVDLCSEDVVDPTTPYHKYCIEHCDYTLGHNYFGESVGHVFRQFPSEFLDKINVFQKLDYLTCDKIPDLV